MNTGAAFPETRELMERINKLVPHFVEIKSDVISDIAEHGWPVDVVPTLNTHQGQRAPDAIKLRSWAECCTRNMWLPMNAKNKELGITEVIRGQRNEEIYKSTIRDGAVHDGITYRFPLQDWTARQVFDYLTGLGVEIPEYYEYTPTSLDCWLCTAYLDTKAVQLKYTKEFHPHKHQVVVDKLVEIKAAIDRTYKPLQDALA